MHVKRKKGIRNINAGWIKIFEFPSNTKIADITE
jgi:hypothetical protein